MRKAARIDLTRHRFGASVFDAVLAAASQTAASSSCLHYDRQLISLVEEENRVFLKSGGGSLPFGRAREYPPLKSVPSPTTAGDDSKQIASTAKPYVSLATSGLVIRRAVDDGTNGDSVLLTRRPSWMRTFPNAYVLPGGAVEIGESLSEAVVREVREEVGLSCDEGFGEPLCLWESVYPTNGEPAIRAHHLVVYFLLSPTTAAAATAKDGGSAGLQLILQKSEVDRAVWLDREELKAIVGATLNGTSLAATSMESKSPLGGEGTDAVVPLADLVGIYPTRQPTSSGSGGEGTGGLAQGSLFALQEFLLREEEIPIAA